jgi:hypothetical protein
MKNLDRNLFPRMKTFLCSLILLAAAIPARADRDITPVIARAIASSDGAYFMLVVPVSDRRINWLWTVYAMGDKGLFKEVWSTGGLHFRELFLANDGRHVACVETWPQGHQPKNDIVVAIYDEGRLVRAYRPTEIVHDLTKIQESSAHYRWLAQWPPVFIREDRLYFTTIEDEACELDMKTGKISPAPRGSD